MAVASMAQDVISFDSGVSACEKAGEWSESLYLLQLMERQKVEPIAAQLQIL